MAQFNLDDVKEQSYINEEGEYTLKVIDVAKDSDGNITQETSTGTPFHKYICETEDGARINNSLYMSDKAIWRYKQFLSALGVDVKGLVIDTDNFDPRKYIDKSFKATVVRCQPKLNEYGEYEESKYFEISKFYKIED
jgi:dipeptidyl aminopeptidase/acylaminoacyl peptidase